MDVWQASETSYNKTSLHNFKHHEYTYLNFWLRCTVIIWWLTVCFDFVYMEANFSQIQISSYYHLTSKV